MELFRSLPRAMLVIVTGATAHLPSAHAQAPDDIYAAAEARARETVKKMTPEEKSF